MSEKSFIRVGAASGLVALVFGGVGGALERGWPSATDPGAVADFVSAHRVAILAQSMAFLLSAALIICFFSGLRSFVARSEGESEPACNAMFGASLVWASLQMIAQSFQVGVAMAPAGGAPSVLLWFMSAAFSISNLPLAIALSVFAAIARQGSFPSWLWWISAAAACAEFLLFVGTVLESGPLGPNGWLTYTLYPVFLVWLVPTAVIVLKRTGGTFGAGTTGDRRGGGTDMTIRSMVSGNAVAQTLLSQLRTSARRSS